jgi:MFS family permease
MRTISPPAPERLLAMLCFSTFLGFLTVGLPLPVISLYVHEQLGFGSVLVGTAVGIQFLSTLLTRGYAGRIADTQGPRPAMINGLWLCALSGLLYIATDWLPLTSEGRLGVMIIGRLILGYGQSLLVAGMLGWGIGTVGGARSGKVMAWTGMAIYGAMALGAPLGLWLYRQVDLALVGLLVGLLPALGVLLVRNIPTVPVTAGERRSFIRVLGSIWQPGMGLALQGVGFAAIGAFISLHFVHEGWAGAGLALTCFGLSFALVRVFFGHLPDKLGGPRVAVVALMVEAAGLFVLYLAPSAPWALAGAAITGLGSSLIFPSLGLVVVSRVEPQMRATALGGYAAFQDVAYGLTGPLAGLMVGAYGYASAFLLGAIAALIALVIALQLSWVYGKRTATC